jgi:hypothetical protein
MIWLKRIGMGVAALVIWIALTLTFISKERLCNALIEKASQEKVTLCYEKRATSADGCELRFVTLLFAHSPVAKVKTFSATPWRVTAKGIRLTGMAASAFPPRITLLKISPIAGEIYAEGEFGTMRGTFSLAARHLTLWLTPSSIMQREYRSTLRMFKRKNGKFVYETAF